MCLNCMHSISRNIEIFDEIDEKSKNFIYPRAQLQTHVAVMSGICILRNYQKISLFRQFRQKFRHF